MTAVQKAQAELDLRPAPSSTGRLGSTAAGSRILLTGVRWQTYQALLADLGDRPLRLTYDRGKLELMTLSDAHESYKKLLGRFLETVTLELNIPIRSLGSRTLEREDLQRGIEADECYYILNEHRVRGKLPIDLAVDPPPDRAMEIDIGRGSESRQPVYAALGIPELWRFDGQTLSLLNRRGEYIPSDRSLNLPFLPLKEIVPFLQVSSETDETTLMRSLVAWVRERLGAHRRELPPAPG
jgi:Uma2 family endonuclease